MKTPANAPEGTTSGLMDLATLMRIRNLELRARLVVEGFWTGLHRSPFHGFSSEFTEYRPYVAGDDLRYLDWRVLARSDRFFIKKYEDETNVRCHVLVDVSRSMSFGTIGYVKAQYAATLAATLAYFLHGQGDAVGLMTFDRQVCAYLPARHRRGHLRQMMLALDRPSEGRGTSLAAPMERLAELSRQRGVVVLLSDFLEAPEIWEKGLRALVARGHELLVFHLSDPGECSFNFPQAARFEDMESGRELLVDPAAIRESYLQRVQAHHARVREICRTAGAAYQAWTTDQPLELALFHFLRERMQRGRLVKRKGAISFG